MGQHRSGAGRLLVAAYRRLVQELRPGLWHWTAPHPDWTPDEGGPDGWDQDVACYAYSAPDRLVLIDPLEPPSELEALARERGELTVALTCQWHARSAPELQERLGAVVYAPSPHDGEVRLDAQPVKPAETLPGGVEVRPTSYGGEVVLWIPQHGALVFGDALLGGGPAGVRIQESWLPKDVTLEQFKAALHPLLELPVELVLPTHGEPVENGRDALRHALQP